MEANNSGHVQCGICPRTFASQRAVHGHMRIHSPSERQAARSDPGEGSQVAAPLRSAVLQGFARTGKRWSFKHRTSVLAGPWASEVGVTSGIPQPPLVEERRRTDLLPRFARTGKRWSFKRRAGPVAPVVRETSTSNPPPRGESQTVELAASVCGICRRCFSSRLALGGHKAHHSMREKKRLAAMGDENDDDYQALVVYEPIPCPRCGRVFSSPQDLGAHDRHCKGPPRPPPPPLPPLVVREFDLNELPPQEEGGEV